jgi:hypothetical protein
VAAAYRSRASPTAFTYALFQSVSTPAACSPAVASLNAVVSQFVAR